MSKKNNKPVDAELELQRQKRSQRYAQYRKKQESEEKPTNFKSTLLRLLQMLSPYKVPVIVVFVAAAIGTLLNLPGPDYMGDLIDVFSIEIKNKLAIPGYDMQFEAAIRIIGIIFLLYFGNSMMTFVQQYLMAGVTQKLVCQLRERINTKLTHLPLRYFDKYTKGEILSKIVNDCDNISNSLQGNITTVLTSLIQVVGVGIYMFILNWQLALIAIVLVPVSTAITKVISKRSKILFRQHWDRLGEMNGHIEEMYTGHNMVRIFNREKAAVEEFDDIADNLYDVTRRANFVSGLINPILKFFNNINYVALCFVGALLVVKDPTKTSIGVVVAFLTYSSLFSSPISNIAKIINTIQSTLASSERVFDLLDEEEEPADSNTSSLTTCSGQVDFENVDFSYVEDVPLIENLNVNVKPGELVAIVGPTGAGKTTIVNLLMRFYDITGGSIKIDGVDIRDMSRNELRSFFGMVLQDTWLFKGTIKDNIAYGREDATEEEIIEAAKAARLHDYIMQQPEGYNMMLEEDGENLSQGQRQLLTIARAILSNPKMLILDEATSSVDTRTEIHIQEAMEHLMQGRTSFVIAHRLSTIKNADTILVMRRGSIVEKGSHEELLAAGGFYASLYNSQYTGGIPPEDTE